MLSRRQVIEDYKIDPIAAREKYNTLQYFLDRKEIDKQKMRGYYLKKMYSITPEEYEALLLKQGGVCAICKTAPSKRRLSVDHSHSTGKYRGLLCGRCNSGLGYFLDNIAIIQAAIEYLRKY